MSLLLFFGYRPAPIQLPAAGGGIDKAGDPTESKTKYFKGRHHKRLLREDEEILSLIIIAVESGTLCQA